MSLSLPQGQVAEGACRPACRPDVGPVERVPRRAGSSPAPRWASWSWWSSGRRSACEDLRGRAQEWSRRSGARGSPGWSPPCQAEGGRRGRRGLGCGLYPARLPFCMKACGQLTNRSGSFLTGALSLNFSTWAGAVGLGGSSPLGESTVLGALPGGWVCLLCQWSLCWLVVSDLLLWGCGHRPAPLASRKTSVSSPFASDGGSGSLSGRGRESVCPAGTLGWEV